MTISEKQFLDTYSRLPKDVQEAMVTYDSANVIYETAKAEGLLPQVSRIAEITGDVMMGFVPITQFRKTLESELHIEEDKARRIAQVIRDKIFLKVADGLRRIHGLK